MENLDKTTAQRDATISHLAEDVAADPAPQKKTFNDLPYHQRVGRMVLVLAGFIGAVVFFKLAGFDVVAGLVAFVSLFVALVTMFTMLGFKDSQHENTTSYLDDPLDPASPIFHDDNRRGFHRDNDL
jgi:hypothetical protein